MAPQLRSPENDTKLPENPPHSPIDWGPSPANLRQSPSAIPVDFSPPLIAMVVVAATAFLVVSYFRLISRHLLPPVLLALRQWRHRWRRWRHRPRNLISESGDIQSPPSTSMYDSTTTTTFHLFSPYGLDEDVIKTIPLSVYSIIGRTSKGSNGRIHDCAVCLLEFEENDYVRTLPVCAHAFHVDCIDIWLRSHANCPLCRAGIFRPESPFIPLMASRIRPSFDDGILDSFVLESRSVAATISDTPAAEIVPIVGEGSMRRHASEDHPLNYHHHHHHHSHRDFMLKRSYSFGFERSLGADRMVLEAATATPWRYHRRGSFWSKRPSPFTSLSKHRVFSFRSYRGMKSPFFRRRQTTFFPMSESNVRFSGGGSSRRSKSLASPMFMRSSGIMAFSSSRMRCGDLEALLSPERLNGR